MGWLHAGHVSLVERCARLEMAPTVVMSIFVNPQESSARRPTSSSTRATRRRDPRGRRRPRGRHRVRAAGRGGLPARVRHAGLGGGDRGAARGRGPARALRRGGDGGRDPVRAGGRGSGLLRAQGLPADPGDHADGLGPRAADRGRALRDGPRARRPGAVVAQRAAVAGGGAGGGPPCCTVRCWQGRSACGRGEASGAVPCGRRCSGCSPASRGRTADYVSVADR